LLRNGLRELALPPKFPGRVADWRLQALFSLGMV